MNKSGPKFPQGISQNQIFKADETGLFWQMLPQQMLRTSKEKCCGGKQNKARIAVLLVANMNGSTELRPLDIGKFRTTNCTCNRRDVLATYAWNKKSRIMRNIFEKWLEDWDAKLAEKGRKACLLFDNCSARHTNVPLKNMELKFLPPNTTSKLQPLGRGIIRTFEAIYKRRLIETLLLKLQTSQDLKIDLLGVIQILKAA